VLRRSELSTEINLQLKRKGEASTTKVRSKRCATFDKMQIE
jgi:hypothetical protein